MTRVSWYRRLFPGPSSRRLRRRYQPRLEELEDRRMPSITARGNGLFADQAPTLREHTGSRSVAESPDGSVVAVWEDEDRFRIHARIFEANGEPRINEIV